MDHSTCPRSLDHTTLSTLFGSHYPAHVLCIIAPVHALYHTTLFTLFGSHYPVHALWFTLSCPRSLDHSTCPHSLDHTTLFMLFGSHYPAHAGWWVGVRGSRRAGGRGGVIITVPLYYHGSHALWIKAPLYCQKRSAFWITGPSPLPRVTRSLDHTAPLYCQKLSAFWITGPLLLQSTRFLITVPPYCRGSHIPSTARDHTSPLYCHGSHIPSLLPGITHPLSTARRYTPFGPQVPFCSRQNMFLDHSLSYTLFRLQMSLSSPDNRTPPPPLLIPPLPAPSTGPLSYSSYTK